MRTVPVHWPGFVARVLEAANCAPGPGQQAAVVDVRYRADGRVTRITPQDTQLSAPCMTAAIALAALTVADLSYQPPAGQRETLVLQLGPDDAGCATPAGTAGGNRPPKRVDGSGRITAPKKVRHVNPQYPSNVTGATRTGFRRPRGGHHDHRLRRWPAHPAIARLAVQPVLDPGGVRLALLPTTLDDVPVPVIMTVTVTFSLQ